MDNKIFGNSKCRYFITIKITFYAMINLLSLATKDYLVPKKKLLGIRKAYLILNEAILNYVYGLVKLEELNDAVKKEKTLLLIYL